MPKLSTVFSKKRSSTRSAIMSCMANRRIAKIVEDYDRHTLLGDLFIAISDDGDIVDLSGNSSIASRKINVVKSEQITCDSCSIAFNGTDSSINVKVLDKVELSMEDFSLDWWECPKAITVPNTALLSPLQCIICKNALTRKNPIILQNDDTDKRLFISSDGDCWDIADSKYMGSATKDVWTHWAVIRCNTVFYTFRNGRLKNMWASDKGISNDNSYFTIGGGPLGSYFYGHINKFRFTKGQALWTEEFSVEDDLFY